MEPPGGFTDELLDEILQHKEKGDALASHPLGQPYQSPDALVDEIGRPGTVVVDCTASDRTVDGLLLALERGSQVVLANKKPLTVVQDVYDGISRTPSQARWETTVGAGLPVIATLNRLVSSGDGIERIARFFQRHARLSDDRPGRGAHVQRDRGGRPTGWGIPNRTRAMIWGAWTWRVRRLFWRGGWAGAWIWSRLKLMASIRKVWQT